MKNLQKGAVLMKVNELVKKAMLCTTARKAVCSSVKSANTACMLWQYQPKMPDKVKKMRKF